jgi:outer membrane autotransporter protein
VSGNSSGSTSVRVNGFGPFSATGIPNATDGISLIQVAGTSSPGAFTLGGVTGGSPFQYNLNAYGPGSPNGLADPGQNQTAVGNPGGYTDYRLQTAYVTPAGPLAPLASLAPSSPSPSPPDARPEVAPQVPAYLSAPTALFNAGFQDLDSLHRRLGEIHDDQILGLNPQGEVFLRNYGTTFNYTSNLDFNKFGFNSSGDYAATQLGGDWIARNDEAGTLRLGVFGTLGRLWYQPSAVDGESKGQFNTDTLAGSMTWQAQQGWYVDAILQGGMFDGTVSTPNRGQTVGFNGTSLSVSLESGYPIPLGWQGMSLEPELQFVYQHLSFPTRTDVNGIGVNLGSPDQGIFRGGVRLIRRLTGPNGMSLTPYLEANVLQGIGGGDDVRLSNVAFDTGHFGTAMQVGGGMTGTISRNLSLYGEVAWQSTSGGNGGFRGWAFNFGLRFTFGAAPVPSPAVTALTPAPASVRTYLVFFDWDRADLTDRTRRTIAEAAAASTRVRLTRIQVNGYTDTSGTPRYNQALSVRRARAVAGELMRDGVSGSSIAIRGLGETNLLVPTGPGVREWQNRRVEIVPQ